MVVKFMIQFIRLEKIILKTHFLLSKCKVKVFKSGHMYNVTQYMNIFDTIIWRETKCHNNNANSFFHGVHHFFLYIYVIFWNLILNSLNFYEQLVLTASWTYLMTNTFTNKIIKPTRSQLLNHVEGLG